MRLGKYAPVVLRPIVLVEIWRLDSYKPGVFVKSNTLHSAAGLGGAATIILLIWAFVLGIMFICIFQRNSINVYKLLEKICSYNYGGWEVQGQLKTLNSQ